MRYKSLSYFGLVDRARSPGVARKIDDTVLAAAQIGLDSRCNLFPATGAGAARFIVSVLKDQSDVIMIRFSDLVFPALFFAMVAQRLRGRKIIIDVPTPRVVGLNEINSTVKNPINRGLRKAWNYLSGAWVLYPANSIVQYADEAWWFSYGVSKKTIKIGNGIIFDERMPLVNSTCPAKGLNLIGVAQLANWHGYDRLIRALDLLRKQDPCYRVRLTLVGAGDELPILKSLVSELGLQDQVSFTGMLTGPALDLAFEGAHIGIASLGLYRIGLNEASVLKVREYMARGLPVIGVGKDPDFEEDSPFRFVVSNDDSVERLAELLYRLKGCELPRKESVRRYAEENLSLAGKLSMILGLG